MTTYNWGAASVQIAFQNNPFDASPTWTDITVYVEGFQVTAGRQHELQQVAPGTCNLTLTNQDGRFSPWNVNGPYYYSGTGLVPGHPVRVIAQQTSASVGTPVFYGYAKGWIPAYGQTKATMNLQCYSVEALLNLNTLDVNGYAVYPLAYAQHYWPLSDPPGSQTAADVVGTATAIPQGTGTATFGHVGPFLTAPNTAALVENEYLNVAASLSGSVGSIDGWVAVQAGTAGNSDVYFQSGNKCVLYVDPSGYPIARMGSGSVSSSQAINDGNWHYLASTYDGASVTVYVDGASVAVAASSGNFNDTLGNQGIAGTNGGPLAGFSEIAIYPTCLAASVIATQYAIATAGFVTQNSGARISAVLALAGVPSSQNNVGAGYVTVAPSTSSLAATTAMSYINTVVNTERGMVYQDPSGVVQFRNRHYVYENFSSANIQQFFGAEANHLHYFSSGLVPGEDDLDLWNNIPVGRSGGVVQTALDSASQTSYGRRTLTGYTNLLFVDDGDSYDLAGGLLYQYKQPAARLRSISMDSTIGHGANMTAMLTLKLLDRIQVYWRPLDGTTPHYSQQSLIEQIQHTVTPEVWTTTFAITPIGTETFFLLGSGVLDSNVLGF